MPTKNYLQARIDFCNETIAKEQQKILEYESQIEILDAVGKDDFEDGAVIMFQKTFGRTGGSAYTYVGTRIKGKWYITTNRILDGSAVSWEKLWDFIMQRERVVPQIWYVTEWAEAVYRPDGKRD